jgi:hypothetical protein
MAIKDWIERISKPSIGLEGMPVCPYAKGADYTIEYTDGSNISPPPWAFDLYIYVLPDLYDQDTVVSIAQEYNKLYADLVFLPDPKDRYTEINGVQTNNGEHNIILCQWRDDLERAREKLATTKYYQYWTADYLQEILQS